VAAVIFSFRESLRPFRNRRVLRQTLNLAFLFIMARFKRKANATDSPASSRKKGKLSSKRLISMINSNKGVDVGLESDERIDVDGIDLRTGRDRGALLLWVCFLDLLLCSYD
jgi:hypothetical protein